MGTIETEPIALGLRKSETYWPIISIVNLPIIRSLIGILPFRIHTVSISGVEKVQLESKQTSDTLVDFLDLPALPSAI